MEEFSRGMRFLLGAMIGNLVAWPPGIVVFVAVGSHPEGPDALLITVFGGMLVGGIVNVLSPTTLPRIAAGWTRWTQPVRSGWRRMGAAWRRWTRPMRSRWRPPRTAPPPKAKPVVRRGSHEHDDLFDRIMMPVMPIVGVTLLFAEIGWCLAIWPRMLGLVDDDMILYARLGADSTDGDPGGVLAWLPYVGVFAAPALALLVMVVLTIVAKVSGGDLGDAVELVVSYLFGALFVLSPIGLTIGWLVAVPLGRVAMALGMTATGAWLWTVLPLTGLIHFVMAYRYSAWMRGPVA